MRFYQIDFTNPKTGDKVLPSSLGGMGITSLLSDGTPNPAALNIEFDIPFLNFANPNKNAWLRIWGLSLKDIGAALDLNDINVLITAGMSKGLPLANPTQQGVLLKGSVFQAYGNWIGTDQTLDMNFQAANTTDLAVLNYPFLWKKGTTLATAIKQTLSVGMPNQKQDIQISSDLTIGYDETGFYTSPQQFAAWINARSKSIIGGTYPGVTIVSDGVTVTVYDGTVKPDANKVKKIGNSVSPPPAIALIRANCGPEYRARKKGKVLA